MALTRLQPRTKRIAVNVKLLLPPRQSPGRPRPTSLSSKLACCFRSGFPCGVLSALVVLATALGAAPPSGRSLQKSTPNESQVRTDLARQISAAEATAAAHPRDPTLLLQLVALYDGAGEFKRSLPVLEKLTGLQPDNLEIYRRLGIDRFHTGRPEEALEPLRRVVETHPDDAEANFYLGLCYIALNREDEANKAFARQAASAPADEDELYLLVRGYGHLSSAMLSRLEALGDDSSRMHQVRGEYFDMENAPELAIKEYEKAVQLRPDVPSLHYVLGTAYWKHSELEKAAPELRRAIELSPRHFMAHYTLGMVLLEQNKPAEAMKEFQEAIAIQPGIVNGYLGLGKALYQQGQYDAAVPKLQHYIDLAPDDPTPNYLLYQIFRRQNKEDSAQEQLRAFKIKDEKAKAAEPKPMGRTEENK
jgi:tetratricopeptide (TPR) repeat protein